MAKRALVLVVAAIVVSGCAINRGGSTEWYVFTQVGAAVRVVNNCAPLLDLEYGGGEVKGLPYGNSTTVMLVPQPFGGRFRQMPITAKGYGVQPLVAGQAGPLGPRVYLGSATRVFFSNTYVGTQEEVWEVNYLHLPNGRGGCV